MPVFDARTGMVTATDGAGSMARNLRVFLRNAKALDILVTLVLWNGALMREPNMQHLITSRPKLWSFFDHAR